MLCPDCHTACPGGTPCPQCGYPVPERESFGGEGGHYVRVLVGLSLLAFALFVLITSRSDGPGTQTTLNRLHESGWIWAILAFFLIPSVVGLYYWFMLREEEITVTDTYIARRSYWGNERLAWADVQAFRRHPILFRQTRLGRIASLSRFFRKGALFLDLPPLRYELVGPNTEEGSPTVMYLDPGTINDMPWLLQLIEERIGPPEED